MNEELQIQINQMSYFYADAKIQLSNVLASCPEKFQEEKFQLPVKNLESKLQDITDNLTLSSLEYEFENVLAKLKELSAILDEVDELYSDYQAIHFADSLLGVIDQVLEVHSLNIEQIVSIKELLQPSARH